jgi:hypothetical protein
MRKPSPATVIAMVALFAALGGVAVAGNGDPFLLGRANTAGKQTSLTGNVPNPTVRVENTSTDGNARGVVGVISAPTAAAGSAGVVGSTAATDPGSAGVVAQNTGGGPALKAVVNPGAAPLSVNSSTKVTNLNADQLDGISSNGFIQGKGSTQFTRLLLPFGGTQDNFFVLPGLGGFRAQCSATVSGLLYVVPNGAEGTLTTESNSDIDIEPLNEGIEYAVSVPAGPDPLVSTWQIWTADGTRNDTVWISVANQASGCLFGASALVQAS